MKCIADGCVRDSQTKAGYCVMHYKRWKRNGKPETILRVYSPEDVCEYCGDKRPLRKGLCNPCYIRVQRKGHPIRDKRAPGTGGYSTQGYKTITVNGKRELEHRLIVSAQPGQVVHHKDGDKTNNSPENLTVLNSQSEHMFIHRNKLED